MEARAPATGDFLDHLQVLRIPGPAQRKRGDLRHRGNFSFFFFFFGFLKQGFLRERTGGQLGLLHRETVPQKIIKEEKKKQESKKES